MKKKFVPPNGTKRKIPHMVSFHTNLVKNSQTRIETRIDCCYTIIPYS